MGSATVAVKKPTDEIRICEDYSSGLNNHFELLLLLLLRPEDSSLTLTPAVKNYSQIEK